MKSKNLNLYLVSPIFWSPCHRLPCASVRLDSLPSVCPYSAVLLMTSSELCTFPVRLPQWYAQLPHPLNINCHYLYSFLSCTARLSQRSNALKIPDRELRYSVRIELIWTFTLSKVILVGLYVSSVLPTLPQNCESQVIRTTIVLRCWIEMV